MSILGFEVVCYRPESNPSIKKWYSKLGSEVFYDFYESGTLVDLVKPWAWLFDYGLFFRLFAHIRSSQVAIFLVKESKKCF